MISIYALVDPTDQKIRYIGKSKNPRSRYNQHLKESIQRQNTKKKVWIKSLLDTDQRPELLILHATESDTAARIAESQACHTHIETIFNIHDPRKGAKDLTKNKPKNLNKNS